MVVAGNSSQNENTFLQKSLIGLLYYDLLADVCILYGLLIYLFWAATAFDIFGTDDAEDILHVVSNTHLCQYPFSILWPEFLDVSDITLLC